MQFTCTSGDLIFINCFLHFNLTRNANLYNHTICTIKLTNSLTCQYFLLELIVRIIELVPHSRVDKISNGGGSRGLIGAINSDISGGIDCTCPSKFYIFNIIYPQNKKEILDALHDDKELHI